MTITITSQIPAPNSTSSIQPTMSWTFLATTVTSSVVIKLTPDGLPQENAVLAGVVQAGYTGSVAVVGSDIHVSLVRDTPFAGGIDVDVFAHAEAPKTATHSLRVRNAPSGVGQVSYGNRNWFDSVAKFTISSLVYQPSWGDIQPLLYRWLHDGVNDQLAILSRASAGLEARTTLAGDYTVATRRWNTTIGGFTSAAWHRYTISYDGTQVDPALRMLVVRQTTDITQTDPPAYPDGDLPTVIPAIPGPANLLIGGTFAFSTSITEAFIASQAIWLNRAFTKAQIDELGGAVFQDLFTLPSNPGPNHHWGMQNTHTDDGLDSHVTGTQSGTVAFSTTHPPAAGITQINSTWTFSTLSVSPDHVSNEGGMEVTVMAPFADGTAYIYFGPDGTTDDPICYSGVSGHGSMVTVVDNQFTIRVPPQAVGGPYNIFMERLSGTGSASLLIADAVTVIPHTYQSRVLTFKRVLPPWYKAGIRNPKDEQYPQE